MRNFNYAILYLSTGMIGLNEVAIGSEIAPFGGVKQSGLGREQSKWVLGCLGFPCLTDGLHVDQHALKLQGLFAAEQMGSTFAPFALMLTHPCTCLHNCRYGLAEFQDIKYICMGLGS